MDLNEIKTFFDSNAENDEVKGFVETIVSAKKDDILKGYQESDDFRKAVQSRSDSIVANKIRELQDRWEKEDLPKRLDEEIRKKYPPKTETEKRLEELEAKLKATEREASNAKMREYALKKLSETDAELDSVTAARFVLGDNEDTVRANIEDLVKLIKTYGVKQVDKVVKDHGREPRKSDSKTYDGVITDIETVRKMQNENPELLADAIRAGRVKIPGIDLSARAKAK